MNEQEKAAIRWRLILGEFAENQLSLPSDCREMDEALAFLYDREYGEAQGVRVEGDDARKGGQGSSQLTVPLWLWKVRRLFPQKTVEVMQKQALEKYHLTQILTDEAVLRQMEPNMDLLKQILTFRQLIPVQVRQLAYGIVEKVIADLRRRLEEQVRRSFYGKKLPLSNSPYRVMRNFDFKRTIRHNLKHYHAELGTVVLERLFFNQNVARFNPWHIVILIDESGSMLNSVIYSAVMASIFAKMPFLSVRLAIFDTEVVDLSDYLEDPVEVLMKVQLGGGTSIHRALEYGRQVLVHPQKTIVVLVSDLYEGTDYRRMYRACHDLVESGCRLWVLPALDYASAPCYDKNAAATLARLGADVAAITPEELGEWIGRIIY